MARFASAAVGVAFATAAVLLVPAAAQPPATATPTFIPLAFGVPAVGYVPKGSEQFYSAVLPLPLPRTTVVCTPLAGNPDMYVTMGKWWDPTPGNSEWSSSGRFGSEILVLPFNASFTSMGIECRIWEGATNCTMNIGIYGAEASNYTLTIVSDGASEVLLEGVPAAGAALAIGSGGAGGGSDGGGDYYNYSVPAPEAAAAVTFRATPTDGGGGGLGLYVSSSRVGQPRPGPSSPTGYCFSAFASDCTSGVMTVTISNASSCFCGAETGCMYFAGVVNSAPVGSPDAGYLIVAESALSPYVILTDGTPQSDVGTVGAGGQYLFNAELDPAGIAGSPAVELTLTPVRGTVQLFVTFGQTALSGQPPGPGNFVYASAGGSGTQAISIQAADPAVTVGCGGGSGVCPIRIAAVPSSGSAAWSIVASGGAYVSLRSNFPVEGQSPPGGVAYYRFPVTRPGPILISAAAVAGDPSIYVGCDSNNATQQPDPRVPGSYLWASVSAGDEIVAINPATDPNACTPPCNYYIGVTSADWAINGSTAFFVLGRSNNSGSVTATPLVIGDLLLDAVPTGMCNAYVTPLDPAVPSVTIALYTTFGDTAAYARLDNTSVTPANAQYVSAASDNGAGGGDGTGSSQQLVVSATDPAYNASGCNVGAGCAISLLVCDNTTAAQQGGGSAPTSASSYQLSAAAGVQQLSDGLPVQGTVQMAPAIMLYRYTVPYRAPFTVTLTPLSGDPDLFMSYAIAPNTSVGGAQWSSLSPQGEYISVQWTEPWIGPGKVTFPAEFIIGVSGFDSAARYSLVVNSNPYTQLENGVPQLAQSKDGLLTYFLFQIPQADPHGFEVGFSFSLTPISGDGQPLIFANTVNHSRQYCAHCGYPYCGGTPCTASNIVPSEWGAV